MYEKKNMTLRLDAEVMEAIDARCEQVGGLSRNAWIEKVCKWALHNLPDRQSTPIKERAVKQAFADTAPPEVAGTSSFDMGLDSPEGR